MNTEAMNRAFKAKARAYARTRTLPASIDTDDLVQEAWIVALETQDKYTDDGRATLASFLTKPIHWRWADVLAASHVGPGTAVRCAHRKRGFSLEYSEVSYDAMAEEHSWVDVGDGEPMRFVISKADAEEMVACANLCIGDGKGVSYAKTLNKWRAEIFMRGQRKFIGHFSDVDDAVASRDRFLSDFAAAALDCVGDVQ